MKLQVPLLSFWNRIKHLNRTLMKRLDISHNTFELNITYRWFSPIAFFLLFFCLFWDGFLVLWYGIGMATGDMPSMFFLFPLIHVAVGVGLTYYTICLFINRSHITTSQRILSVRHAPLPWPRGNKEIEVKNIEQLYVEEKTGSKGSKYHILRAMLTDGEKITLLGNINAPAETLLELERTIEDYVGISDAPVIGEMQGSTKTSGGTAPNTGRRTPRQAPGYSARAGVEAAAVGDFVTYEGRTFEVSYVTSYDWNNGDIDRLLQLASPDGQHALLYIQQDKGLFKTYLEVEFTKAQQLALEFESRPAPKALDYQNAHYELYSQQLGQQYIPRRSAGIPAEQWTYFNEQETEYLRILDHQGMETVYFGQAEVPAAFSVLKP